MTWNLLAATGCIAVYVGALQRTEALLGRVVARTRTSLLAASRVRDPSPDVVLGELSRSLRSGQSLRNALIELHRGSADHASAKVVARLKRGDDVCDVARDGLAHLDVSVRRAIELADVAGPAGADVLDAIAESCRQAREISRLAHSAGAHARSTMAMLTGASLVVLAGALVVSPTARSFVFSSSGLVTIVAGAAFNFLGRRWVQRGTTRRIVTDLSHDQFRDVVIVFESLVLAGYSLQGAVMSAHTFIDGPYSEFLSRAAEQLHSGRPFEIALAQLESDPTLEPLVTALRLAHRDGLAVGDLLREIRDDATSRERHRLTAQVHAVPTRLIVPLVTCGLPSFILIGVVPVLVAIFGGLAVTQGG